MVESRFRDLLLGNPAVEEILTPGEGSGARNMLSRLAVIRELRRRGFCPLRKPARRAHQPALYALERRSLAGGLCPLSRGGHLQHSGS